MIQKIKYPLLIAAGLFLFFFAMNRIPLWSSDEGRFAEIAREMAETKDFIVPQFNYVDHFEKPIFAYLVTAFSFMIFGVHSLTARFPSLLAALAGIGMTFISTKALLNKRAAEMASIALSTSIGYVIMGRTAMIDMLMLFLMSASLFCLMAACLKNRPRFYLLSYVFMGFAFVTKGAMGIVLPAFIFLTFLAWTKNFRELLRIRLGWGVLIIALIFVPWGIAISMREPEFSYVFLWKHQMTRFATEYFGRKRPVWFFIPILFSLAFPWSFFLPQAVRNGLRESPEVKKVIQFLVVWIGVMLLFFSIPKSKLPYYILPVSMPLSVLVGHLFYSWEAAEKCPGASLKGFRMLFHGIVAALLAGIVGINAFLLFWTQDPRALAVKPTVHIFSFVLFLTVAGFYGMCRKKEVRDYFYFLSGIVYLFLITVFLCMVFLTPFFSTYDFASALKPQLQKGDIVAMYSSPDHFSDFPFHMERRIVVVGSDRGTLTDEISELANADSARGWFPETGAFMEGFNTSSRRIFCLLEEKNLDEMKRSGLVEYKTIKQEAGKILIANR